MTKQTSFIDEENYHRCSEPFESMEEANTAVNAFMDELYALRNKHQIANVSIVIMDSVKKSGPVYLTGHYGNGSERESMAAYAYGQAVSERQHAISELIGNIMKKQNRK